jgi:hypothetical protein
MDKSSTENPSINEAPGDPDQAFDRTLAGKCFAAFICFLGLVLFVVSMLTTLWPEPTGTGLAYILKAGVGFAIGMYAAGVALAFWSVWGFGGGGGVPLARIGTGLGRWGVGLIFAALLVVPIIFAFDRPPSAPPTEFSLLLPSPPATGSPDGTATSNELAAMSWSVPEAAAPFPTGLLLMILASLVITIYGIIYPIIVDSRDDEAKGFVQRLVVPAVAFVLFGFGASAQVAAEDRSANVNLVARALPPVAGLSRNEVRTYILRGDQIPRDSLDQLQLALRELTERIGKAGNSDQDDRQHRWIAGQIGDIQNQLREGDVNTDEGARIAIHHNQLLMREEFRQYRLALESMTKEATTLRGDAANIVARLNAGQLATVCAVLTANEISQRTARLGSLEDLRRIQTRERENVATRTWLGIIGRHPSALRAEQDRLRTALGSDAKYDQMRQACLRLLAPPQ